MDERRQVPAEVLGVRVVQVQIGREFGDHLLIHAPDESPSAAIWGHSYLEEPIGGLPDLRIVLRRRVNSERRERIYIRIAAHMRTRTHDHAHDQVRRGRNGKV